MPPLLLKDIGNAIAANTNAKLVFVDNLSREFGPAGTMSLQERLKWCKRACGGRSVDIVLGEHCHETLETLEPNLQCIQVNLASANHEWRHDRKNFSMKLRKLFCSRCLVV